MMSYYQTKTMFAMGPLMVVALCQLLCCNGQSSSSDMPRFKNIKIAPGTSSCKSWIDQIEKGLPPPSQTNPIPGHCTQTNCPKAVWLEQYYRDIVSNKDQSKDPFVGIVVGCENGLRAVNALRMGSNNDQFSLEAWSHQMIRQGLTEEDVLKECVTSFPINNAASTKQQRNAVVHCIEPLPSNHMKLHESAKHLQWSDDSSASSSSSSLVVSPYALSSEDQIIHIPTKGPERSSSVCNGNDPAKGEQYGCQSVQAYSLGSYVNQFVFNEASNNKKIHFMRINNVMETDDGETPNVLAQVLRGGRDILSKTEYVELVWQETTTNNGEKKQNDGNTMMGVGGLRDALMVLEGQGHSCYWAGNEGQLYRINGPWCFLDYYEIKCPATSRATLVCANRFEAPDLVGIMENIFLRTVGVDENHDPTVVH